MNWPRKLFMQGLDRKLGRPRMVKEVVLDFQPDPDLKSIRGREIICSAKCGGAIGTTWMS
jgi:hypothetical protein